MADDQNWTTANIDAETARMADAIAAKLSADIRLKVSRAAVIRRAVADLFLREFPSDRTDNVVESAHVTA